MTSSSAKFIDLAKAVKVGDGLDPASKMGPLANPRRVNAMESILLDAQEKGAKVQTGGKRIGNEGNFFEPTVLTDVRQRADHARGAVRAGRRHDAL